MKHNVRSLAHYDKDDGSTAVVNVEVVETSELGNRSYIAHDGASAVVIDPQRDLDRVEAVLANNRLTCVVVLETHVHNDYVTGGYELARRTGARYVLSEADAVDFSRHAVRDGDEMIAGQLRIRVVATPGHTDTHLAYIIDMPADAPPEPPALFTGGSLLYGSVGRTDLVDPARTEELTRAQFRSARRLADLLGDDARVFPTHGFGSFCSAGATSGSTISTMGQERAHNEALTEADEDAFVARLIAGLTAYPRYYAHMDARNRQGPGPAELSAPEPVEPTELRKRIAAEEWVVDLRDHIAYAAEHLAGSIGIALGQQFSTYLGWLIPWGTPLTLIGDSADQVADAQRQLVRIGIDRPAGAAVGTPGELAIGAELRSYRRATFSELAAEDMPVRTAGPSEPDGAAKSGVRPVVLDVRRDDERTAGHVPGSIHVPLHSLLERLDDLPDAQLWVHCASGVRAAIAASLLDRAGHDVVLIDGAYPPL